MGQQQSPQNFPQNPHNGFAGQVKYIPDAILNAPNGQDKEKVDRVLACLKHDNCRISHNQAVDFLAKVNFKEGKIEFLKGITPYVDTPDYQFLINILKKMNFDEDRLEAVKIYGPGLPPHTTFVQKNEVLNGFIYSDKKDLAKPYLGL